MKKYILLILALSLAISAIGRTPKQKKSRQQLTEDSDYSAATLDSLRLVTDQNAALIDSLQTALFVMRSVAVNAAENASPKIELSPEQRAADSIENLRFRLGPRHIKSTFDIDDTAALDTLESGNDAVKVVLYSNNTWKYVRNREVAKDSTIFEKHWDTTTLFPYRDVDMSAMPKSVIIDLIDSMTSYHYPYQGAVHPHGKFGQRRRRQHQGVDLPLKMGDPVYATFCGRVRISQYNKGGYGNLVIIRHDNGLETYYGHLSERLVEPNQWVEAGQVIGLGGSTGRSTGPHLHFETRYYGQAFNPEQMIDFKEGLLCRETFLLKKSSFNVYSNVGQNFDDEEANEQEDKKEAAEKAAMRYHKIKSGDTLGAIAHKYGTTVTNICRMNGIKSTTVLRIGRSLRVR